MQKNYLVQLTFLIYKTTEKFGSDELLKLKLKNLADEFLSGLVLIESSENPGVVLKERGAVFARALGQIDEIGEYLALARARNLVNREDFLFIKQEYDKLSDELEKIKSRPALASVQAKEIAQAKPNQPKIKTGPERPEAEEDLTSRQKKILEVLRKRGNAQVSDLQEFLPQVSKRTLRRDLDGLLGQKFVVRVGQWNEVYYKLTD